MWWMTEAQRPEEVNEPMGEGRWTHQVHADVVELPLGDEKWLQRCVPYARV